MITADSIVKESDGRLEPIFQNVTLVVKQKVSLQKYFQAELDHLNSLPNKPKFKYIVYTVEDADGKLAPHTNKSDNKLGSVDKNGVFTAKKAGKVEVVLAEYNPETKQYYPGKQSVIINIIKPLVKKPVLTYKDESMTVAEYQEFAYAAKLGYGANYADVRYESSKPEVVSVDAKTGKITALKTGSAKITAYYTISDGLTKPSVVKVTTTFSVKIPTFKKTLVTIKAGKSKKTALSNTLRTETLVWSSSNPAVATVDQTGKVTAVAAGKTTIKVEVTSPDDAKTTREYSYEVEVTQ